MDQDSTGWTSQPAAITVALTTLRHRENVYRFGGFQRRNRSLRLGAGQRSREPYAAGVDNWVGIIVGLGLIALVVSDRSETKRNWSSPAQWWSRNPKEYWTSRGPSQPLNVVLGLFLGIAALSWGVIGLLT